MMYGKAVMTMAKKSTVLLSLLLSLLVGAGIAWWSWRRREGLSVDGYDYTRRYWHAGAGKWRCPKGYKDTGKGWDDGEVEGEKQCRRKAEWVVRILDATGSYVCPPGYTDSGEEWETRANTGADGTYQCRKVGRNKTARRSLAKKQAAARGQCGAKPGTDHKCKSWKCKKDEFGALRWICASPSWMGCSTDGTKSKHVQFDGQQCKQKKPRLFRSDEIIHFPMSECCEGPPLDPYQKAGEWGYRTCPGSGRTRHDGC